MEPSEKQVLDNSKEEHYRTDDLKLHKESRVVLLLW
jgi:hypothetical protein